MYLEGRFTEGFLRYEFGGLYFEGVILRGAYFWNFTVRPTSFPGVSSVFWKMENSTASDINVAQWDELNSPLFQFYVD